MAPARPHQYWMAEALRHARKGFYSVHPNPRVGCVIVRDDELIAAGWHEFTGGPHAEVNAINAAKIPSGATFYITLEPCSHHGRTPPCVDAVIATEPARVVVAMMDPNPKVGGNGLERLRTHGIDVVCGVLEEQARALNSGYVKRMEQTMPFVSVKMACSLDGRSALKNGNSKWITAAPARRDVQFLRAQAAAILTTAQTVLDDDPALDLRLNKQDLEQTCAPRLPVRIVLDTNLRLRGDERIFTTAGEIWIYTLSQDAKKISHLESCGATLIEFAGSAEARIPLSAMLRDLAQRGINQVHTECGATLAGALVGAALADQVVLYLAPVLLGSQALGGFDLGEITSMDHAKICSIRDLRQIGDDLRLTLTTH